MDLTVVKNNFSSSDKYQDSTECCSNEQFTSEEMKNTKNSSKSNKVVKAMVDKVKVKSVVVNWQCRAYAKDSALSDLNEKQPSTTVEGPDLEKIRIET